MIGEMIGELVESEYNNFKRYLNARFSQLNEYDAEDIIQETVYKLLYKGDDALSIRNMTSYMYTSLRNGAVDHIKKRKYEALGEDIPEGASQTAEDEVLKSEIKEMLKKAILGLDEKSRYVLIQTELLGKSYSELQKETGIKIGTLLSRKSRAIKKLKTIMSDYLYKEAK